MSDIFPEQIENPVEIPESLRIHFHKRILELQKQVIDLLDLRKDYQQITIPLITSMHYYNHWRLEKKLRLLKAKKTRFVWESHQIQARINSLETVSPIEEIFAEGKERYDKFKRSLKKQKRQNIKQANDYERVHTLSMSEQDELKKEYTIITMRREVAGFPLGNEYREKLNNLANAILERCNLREMKHLHYCLFRCNIIDPWPTVTASEIKSVLVDAQDVRDRLKASIERMKHRFPFTVEQYSEISEIEKRRQSLTAQITQAKKEVAFWKYHRNSMIQLYNSPIYQCECIFPKHQTDKEKEILYQEFLDNTIFLVTLTVAGTTHIENIALYVQNLKTGDALWLIREPKNEYDPNAIRVETLFKQKIGYIPKSQNAVFAALLDGGKKLYARVLDVSREGGWVKIDINVYLKSST